MTGGEWKLSAESGYLTLNNDWGVVILRQIMTGGVIILRVIMTGECEFPGEWEI